LYKDYPEHIIFSMPALSPTMEMGTISKWELKEGDSFTAGAAICAVETDKATMDFEAQDDGFIAKILREGSSAVDIAIGTPICVVVEDEGDVAAFADFMLEEEAPVAAATSEPASAAAAAVAPAPGRQVSDEYVLLPSARFLAESKYVFSIMFSYCLTYPISNKLRTVLEQRSRCNRLGRNSKGWPRNKGRCSSGDQEWNSNARSCNQNCSRRPTPGARSCCCPICSRHQYPNRGSRTSRD
jgi:hypothetical protein